MVFYGRDVVIHNLSPLQPGVALDLPLTAANAWQLHSRHLIRHELGQFAFVI